MSDSSLSLNVSCAPLTRGVSVRESYAHCRRMTRTRAKNLYYSFLLLPREQRDSMCVVYAFMRHCNDLSDGPGDSLMALEEWRVALSLSFAGAIPPHTILPALMDTVKRYRIPRRYFYEMIEGLLTDSTACISENADRARQYLLVQDLVRFGASEDELRAALTSSDDRVAASLGKLNRLSALYLEKQV